MLAYFTDGMEACPVSNADKRSFDFVAIRFLMKLFETTNMDIINDCIYYFKFTSPSKLIDLRRERFMYKIGHKSQILFCSSLYLIDAARDRGA